MIEAEPGLRPDGLKGGARYYDAATDDARLTLANAAGRLRGRRRRPQPRLRAQPRHRGAARPAARVVVDHLTGQEFTVRARAIVNATGPWSDEIRKLDAPARERPAVRGSKGVHIAVPRERLGNRDALTLLSPVDGRVMFVLPADAHTIIGTTETATRAHPAEVRASEADVDYLLASANAFFPEAQLTRDDVVSAWAGIRPLVASGYSGSADAGSASREHAIDVSPAGVLAISGGKLTTYRVMARDVVNAVERQLGAAPPQARHRDAAPARRRHALRWTPSSTAARPRWATRDGPRHLVRAYGSRWRQVWAPHPRGCPARPAARRGPALPARRGRSGVTHELVAHPGGPAHPPPQGGLRDARPGPPTPPAPPPR